MEAGEKEFVQEMKRIYDYKDLQPLLDRLLQDKESSEIEFKSAAGGFPKTFWETYSSFANTNGGTIIFGIKEKGNEIVFDGLTDEQVKKYKRDFFNGMHSKQNANIALLKEEDVQAVTFNGNLFLFFHIPRLDRSLKPVYCGLDPYTGTYRRDLDGDYHCSREEVNSMFSDANLASPADGRILKNFSKEDLDPDSIRQYRRRFEQWNPDHVWNALPEDLFLEKLNVFRKDRGTGEYGLTYAGLLMFGTYSAIMDENPNFFPDYQEVQDPEDRWVNRICPDGNWESNLFQFYSRVLPILQGFLPKPFRLDDNQRKAGTPAHVALREAFVNALVHADHTVNASLNVYKYPNKIVFSNPGTMLISLKQYYKGGESVCRNKYLQTMFTFLGAAEKAGSGADKIIHGWEGEKWKRPYIQEQVRPDKVVLTMSMESMLDDSIKEGLSKYLGGKIDNLPLGQLVTLALAYSEEEITNERLQYALDMHRADITQMLSEMCARNLLESSGHGRGTKYHVYGMNIALARSHIGLQDPNIGLQDPNIGLPETDIRFPMSDISPKKRYTKEEMRELVLQVCHEWKTAEEIAAAVGRKTLYIRDIVLPQLSDALEKMYDIPHHPRQKYRVRRPQNK
ncbi:MAG: putative DNA binding domain-containing protein [Bacteroidales bacterium]|nr:putative DNA binding domain-containing protein [Bacteroidales bacterium]